MLSHEDNALLTSVGPGTPMGDLMRQYWVPALLSAELPAPDCDPVRVLLLGEKLIAFRDTDGRVGLLGNHCPHRGASLFFGRNEECGLRCVYHGWKFDVTGNCVDMPNEPPESNFKHKIKHTAYPCQERGGVVWTYMGPRDEPPPLPDLEPNMLSECMANAVQRECSWLQGLEGEIDTSHFSFLHLGGYEVEDTQPGTFQRYLLTDRAPRFAVVDTEYGTMYGAYREAHEGQDYWRIAQFLLPFYAMIPPGVLGLQRIVRAWVPMDDTHMMFFSMASRDSYERLGGGPQLRQPGSSPWNFRPNTTDWYGRFRLVANVENDYLIDRENQRTGKDYTGISGVHTQDQAITESMGPIYDRTEEHLGAADVMVIRVRRRLLEAVKAFSERGITPPSVDDPGVYRVRSGGVFLPHGADWIEATRELRQAFADHPELDPAIAGGG